ncbi:hypothetical protein CCMSSC00406_0004681 [Pleurotus cornucopiae]|uniref:Uncharacterized protein n=1 Tax=Pleurotus cornucopiae TaxID=5321 RepID=A0ACB7IX34_PLECO|nr:hypothetical protein CCMSSC00406_0004681 [Pleurotus cornucopiae]
MAVKELARLFEPPLDPESSNRPTNRPRRTYTHRNSDDIQPRSPARFIATSPTPMRIDGLPTPDHASLPNVLAIDDYRDSLDITDLGSTKDATPYNTSNDTEPLVDSSKDATTDEIHELLDRSDTATLVERHRFPPHTPVPATVVFSRKAFPLSLPKLDKYLSNLPMPSFSQHRHGIIEMFLPMQKLADSGRTIDDFEANSKVAPAWRNRKTILGSAVNIILGFTGSSALASFYSLQGLLNTIQIFALLLRTIVPVTDTDVVNSWRQLFLGTIPNILALNFASNILQSLIYLAVFMAIAGGLLYYFFRSTPLCDRYTAIEGLQRSEPNTMAVHVIVWSDDLWVVPNYYTNATSFPPSVEPLGPPSEFRDPLDFCWTTTMKKNEINYAPVVIIMSIIVVASLTVWFPLALRKVIQRSAPKVDTFTDLGRPRNEGDMDREYHRLLLRDRNPFSFLYGGYRRGWGTYQSTYLFAKLSTLFIIAVIDSNNCLFRTVSRTWLPIVRQILLLASTIGFFVAQCLLAPFLDPVNNASEWVSRLNYLTTAAVALGVALKIPGKDILNTYILYAIYVITYGFSIYFTLINMSIVHRVVKRLARRVDFSIDVFSPWLDISPSSIHIRRRIWQETITTLILTSPDCQIPPEQDMLFAQARDSEFPPYLLDFLGSPSERHVENLKVLTSPLPVVVFIEVYCIQILREIGTLAYARGVALISGADHELYRDIAKEIQGNFIGPDCYWKAQKGRPNCRSFFGNAWWIPFPPTLVIQYDDGPFAIIQGAKDLEEYITQNSDPDIRRRRDIRLALRALDGQVVNWPHRHVTAIGSNSIFSCKRRYKADVAIQYHTCTLNIKHRGKLFWKDIPLGSGFTLELVYTKDVCLNGEIIGLTEDFDLTPPLARFLSMNRDLIHRRLGALDAVLDDYRIHHEEECRHKRDTLTYAFLTNVYDRPQHFAEVAKWVTGHEKDLRIGQLIVGSEEALSKAYERSVVVAETEAATWWYIFWDDFWRRNNDAIPALQLHAQDFNPHYPTSIAYTPLPRPNLESFLIQRGLMSSTPRWKDIFHHGLLNKIYVRLNDAVFRGSNQAVMFHMGVTGSEMSMEGVDMGQSSTLGTGGGTDHDDESLRPRPTYRWEGLLMDPVRGRRRRRDGWFVKLGAYLGLTPIWRSGSPSKGVSLDVQLQNGRYVVLEEEDTSLDSTKNTVTS